MERKQQIFNILKCIVDIGNEVTQLMNNYTSPSRQLIDELSQNVFFLQVKLSQIIGPCMSEIHDLRKYCSQLLKMCQELATVTNAKYDINVDEMVMFDRQMAFISNKTQEASEVLKCAKILLKNIYNRVYQSLNKQNTFLMNQHEQTTNNKPLVKLPNNNNNIHQYQMEINNNCMLDNSMNISEPLRHSSSSDSSSKENLLLDDTYMPPPPPFSQYNLNNCFDSFTISPSTSGNTMDLEKLPPNVLNFMFPENTVGVHGDVGVIQAGSQFYDPIDNKSDHYRLRFKTELCKHFQEHGNCPYNKRCVFAHGVCELRPGSIHPHYKTRLCENYHGSVHYCKYEQRCLYIHGEDTVDLFRIRHYIYIFHELKCDMPLDGRLPSLKELKKRLEDQQSLNYRLSHRSGVSSFRDNMNDLLNQLEIAKLQVGVGNVSYMNNLNMQQLRNTLINGFPQLRLNNNNNLERSKAMNMNNC